MGGPEKRRGSPLPSRHSPLPTSPEGRRAEGGRGYETRDVQARLILLCGLGLAVLTALVFLFMSLLERRFEGRRAERAVPPAVVESVPAAPPEPRLQVTPAAELGALRVEEDALLRNYGWIDGETARIPIERAMEIISERGLPARKEGTR